jgi:uncharacterized phage-associated protein
MTTKAPAFEFNQTKAIEAILYLSPRITDSDVYGICKLLYLTDKTSLEKYGRFLYGETYAAMVNGPTPSKVYDLLKEAVDTPFSDFKLEGHQIIPLRPANLDHLSESDIECLDQIIALYGNVPNWKRKIDSHDTAWQKVWDKRGSKKSVIMPVTTIAEVLNDSSDLIDYLTNRDAD